MDGWMDGWMDWATDSYMVQKYAHGKKIEFLKEDGLHGNVFDSGHVYEKQIFSLYSANYVLFFSRFFSLFKNLVFFLK